MGRSCATITHVRSLGRSPYNSPSHREAPQAGTAFGGAESKRVGRPRRDRSLGGKPARKSIRTTASSAGIRNCASARAGLETAARLLLRRRRAACGADCDLRSAKRRRSLGFHYERSQGDRWLVPSHSITAAQRCPPLRHRCVYPRASGRECTASQDGRWSCVRRWCGRAHGA